MSEQKLNKRVKGFVRWYDENGDDGMLTDLDGNEWYFNSWSFSGSKYIATGICKKTGRKKSIKTRHFPGLFLQNGSTKDRRVKKCKHLQGVTFTRASGIEQRWAVKMGIDNSFEKEILSSRLLFALDSLLALDTDPHRDIWFAYTYDRVGELLERVG